MTLLREGALAVHGRVTDASNAVLYCTATLDGLTAPCVYKPVSGERPLWDFPDGTLAGRETAAHEVAAATGWHLVPPTLLREGPAGPGMVQLWIEPDPAAPDLLDLQPLDGGPRPGWLPILKAELDGGRLAWLVHRDDERLRRLAVLDAVLNNADRKGGHWLPAADGRVYGIDHGVTFHTDPKLRTLLWGWAGQPLTAEALDVLARLAADLDGGPLADRLRPHLTAAELAALRARTAGLLAAGRHPVPSPEWPSIPWPPV
ncbi:MULTISPECIES: SCO1664 family protein [Kitasatospora]|uniref:SCO1664 family protein n=1 Tax=Kitasatospora sp. SID7827 TaxID=2690335 RepID=UPI0005272053|nr:MULTISPECIES: SCO1664 family protein [Kitasatospora]